MFGTVEPANPPPIWLKVAATLFISICTMVLMIIIGSSSATGTLEHLVTQNIERSGVNNPITAVLLNYRSFDTLLEVAVILLVAIAVKPDSHEATLKPKLEKHQKILLISLINTIVPIAILTSGYLLWIGASEPGGAFQAGALLAGALIVLSSIHYSASRVIIQLVDFACCIGLAVFSIIGLLMLFKNGKFLQYAGAEASIMILIIEFSVTISIACILLNLYLRLHKTYRE